MSVTFEEIIHFIAGKLKAKPPKEEISEGTVELSINGVALSISKLGVYGSVRIESDLGFFLATPSPEKLKQLTTSNFLGQETGGNTLCLKENGVTLKLIGFTLAGATAAESWEVITKFLDYYACWMTKLKKWENFTPLFKIDGEDQEGSLPNFSNYRG